ncbi:MAG: hypothetical protein LBB93_06215 [Elusimicrobiota bacterium]|jgi:hypothetical protein|nr:hypothetical protein [Elusimicrobiota bacterium]
MFDCSLSFIFQIKQITKRLKFNERKIKNVLLAGFVLLLALSGFYPGNKQTRHLEYFYYQNPKFITVFSNLNVLSLQQPNETWEVPWDPALCLPIIIQNAHLKVIPFNETKKWQIDLMEDFHDLDKFLIFINTNLIDKNGNMNNDLLNFLHKNGFQERLLAANLNDSQSFIYELSRTKQVKE